MTVSEAIAQADAILPGAAPADPAAIDPRWQAIIAVAEHIQSEPLAVWEFASRWGGHEDEDLRDAIATCVLEHLLEHHFSMIFPLVVQRAGEVPLMVDTLRRCWKFGAAGEIENAEKLMEFLRGGDPT